MMMRVAVLALLVLAACNRQESGEARQEAAELGEAGGNAVEAVLELSEPQRRAVFLRAIRDAGLDCQQIVALDRVEEQPPMWRATCEDKAMHLLSVSADGMVRVTGRRSS